MNDKALGVLDIQLSKFVECSKQYQSANDRLLQQFRALLENYKALKCEYESQRASQAISVENADNRFVLVLIDGDNYIFDHRYVTEKEQGGRMVAKILKKTVKQLLVSHTPEDMDTNNIRIMVRVYADVLALSKKLAKLKITGREARSLAPFIAGFNQAEPMFEFVDTGDEEICTANKIMETLELFVADVRCKHVFFAGCSNIDYSSKISRLKETGQITLIRNVTILPEFEQLEVPMVYLHTVFQSTPLDQSFGTNTRSDHSEKPRTMDLLLHVNANPHAKTKTTNQGRKVCTFYLKNQCKFGLKCKKRHDTALNQLRSLVPYRGGEFRALSESIKLDFLPSRILPSSDLEMEGLIPVNKYGQRLDIYSVPPEEGKAEFESRTKVRKVCNKLLLGGHCPDSRCLFDHRPMSGPAIEYLRYKAKEITCPSGLSCRSSKCYYGHVCQRDHCRGGYPPCRFKDEFHIHAMDFRVYDWVKPIDEADDRHSGYSRSIPQNMDVQDSDLITMSSNTDQSHC